MSNASNNTNNAYEIDYPDNPKMEAMISIIRLRETLEEFFELTKFEEKLKEYGLQNHLQQHLMDDDLEKNNNTDKFANFTEEILDTKIEEYGDFEEENIGYSYTSYLLTEIQTHSEVMNYYFKAHAYGYDNINVDPAEHYCKLVDKYNDLVNKYNHLQEKIKSVGEKGLWAIEHAEQLEHTLDLYRTYAFDVDDQAN